MAIMEKEEEEKKTYKNPVLFLRKSKAGEHLYAFNIEKEGGMVLGGGVKSLILNVSDIEKLLGGEVDKIKVSITLVEEGGGF